MRKPTKHDRQSIAKLKLRDGCSNRSIVCMVSIRDVGLCVGLCVPKVNL